MVPVIASGGASFQGAFAYYFHDKDAWTDARVAWTQTRNLMTDCAEKAWKVMAYTVKVAERLKQATGQRLSGRKLEKPVFAYSLSWHPEQRPDKAEMLRAAELSLTALGMTEHETMIAAHNDTEHPHIHIIVNRVHPLTGVAAKLDHTKRKLSAFAREYEHTTERIYCMQREENFEKRQSGQSASYEIPAISKAWKESNTARDFIILLEEAGYSLARGNKRLVIVDPYGKAHNPVRYLYGVRATEFNERMASINPAQFSTVEMVLQLRVAVTQKQLEINTALDELNTRHLEEQEALKNKFEAKAEQTLNHLKAHYRFAKREQHIQTLKAELHKPGILRKAFFKISGLERWYKQEIEAADRTMLIDLQSYGEVISRIEDRQATALRDLSKRQAKEYNALAEREIKHPHSAKPSIAPQSPAEKPSPDA